MLAGAKSSQSLSLGISNKQTINIHGVTDCGVQWQNYIQHLLCTPAHKMISVAAEDSRLVLDIVCDIPVIRNIMNTTRAWSIMYIERALPGGGAVVFRGSGGEGDSCREISSLLVLVLALLGWHSRELGTSPAPPQQRGL